MLGPRGVQITEMISETILFVYKADHFPFNAQHNTMNIIIWMVPSYCMCSCVKEIISLLCVSHLYAVLTCRALGRTARIFKTVLYV